MSLIYIMCMIVRFCESPWQDVKPLARVRKDSNVPPWVHPVRSTMKNHFIEPSGCAGRGRKSARHSVTIAQDYRCPFSTAFRLPDRLTWYGSTHQIPCIRRICTSRAMIVPIHLLQPYTLTRATTAVAWTHRVESSLPEISMKLKNVWRSVLWMYYARYNM